MVKTNKTRVVTVIKIPPRGADRKEDTYWFISKL